ncbi:hypothetical protein T06_15571 [Trichinella sp. T6]|nr:hypothetical protein T06_15571 [Trichinella sp. T6]
MICNATSLYINLVKSRNSKQQIHSKHFLLKNKDNKRVNGKKINVSGRSSELRALLIAGFIRRISFVNNGWRELKETPSSDWKIPCQAVMFCVKSRNSKQQIHRKHFSLKNKDYKHVNGGSSEYTVILSVMYHSNVSGRSSELRALLIASFIRRISFVNNGWRELKETPSSDWKIPCQEVIFCVSEKRPWSN